MLELWLNLVQSCVYRLKGFEFIIAITLSFPKDTVSLQSSTTSGFYSLSDPSSETIPKLWKERMSYKNPT